MSILEKILTHKAIEVASMPDVLIDNSIKTINFLDIFNEKSKRKIKLIAEIKKKSPSQNNLIAYNTLEIANEYVKYNVDGMSILTDEKFFAGSFDDIINVRNLSENIPILCKDFIISKKQVDYAKNAGASCVLLIVKALSFENLPNLYKYAQDIGLQCLIEISSEQELEIAMKINPKVIGVNSRNLDTLEVDIDIFQKILPKIPNNIKKVALSGIKTKQDMEKIVGFDAVLIGSSLLNGDIENIGKKIMEFDAIL